MKPSEHEYTSQTPALQPTDSTPGRAVQSTPPSPAHPPHCSSEDCWGKERRVSKGLEAVHKRNQSRGTHRGVNAFEGRLSVNGAGLVGRRANVALGEVATLAGTAGGSSSELAGKGGGVTLQGLSGRGLGTLELGVVSAVGTDGGTVVVAVSGSKVAAVRFERSIPVSLTYSRFVDRGSALLTSRWSRTG